MHHVSDFMKAERVRLGIVINQSRGQFIGYLTLKFCPLTGTFYSLRVGKEEDQALWYVKDFHHIKSPRPKPIDETLL